MQGKNEAATNYLIKLTKTGANSGPLRKSYVAGLLGFYPSTFTNKLNGNGKITPITREEFCKIADCLNDMSEKLRRLADMNEGKVQEKEAQV